LGKFHNILRKLPQKPVTLLNDFEDIALGSNPGDRSKFIDRMKRSGKQHPIQNSTNIVTWALLEAIEMAKEE
jgi:hypothetical protein